MKTGKQRGFSLVELLIVILILTIVMGVSMQQIAIIQQRYRAEEAKTDTFQTAREFMDQMVRDIHNAGFPNVKMYKAGSLGSDYAAASTSQYNGVGLVFVSPTQVQFEGDIDGDGVVDSVSYTLVTSTSGSGRSGCPCVIRSSVAKADGVAPTAQTPSFNTQVEHVTSASLFSYFDSTGNQVTVPSAGYTRTNFDPYRNPGGDPVATILTVKIALTVEGATADPKTGIKPTVSLNSTAQVAN